MKDLIETQQAVARFVEEYDLEASVEARLLDIVSEVGELSKEALKATSYGREAFRKTDGWSDELGDTLFSLVCLANSSGVDLEAALDQALDKYRRRLAARDNAGSGR